MRGIASHRSYESVLRVMPFGKYRGQTFESIAITSPDYLEWVILNLDGPVRAAAQEALSASFREPHAPQGMRPAPSKGSKGHRG